MDHNIRSLYPFFKHNAGLVYVDNAATTQKPKMVIDRISHFYAYENAPVGRSLYSLAEEATEKYEQVRSDVANFIGASHASEIIFTHGATESINMIAFSFLFLIVSLFHLVQFVILIRFLL